jgi:hypothetical protein
MWSVGIANACIISIPSLGLDDKRFSVAAAAAGSARGLSQKKIDKGIALMSSGERKAMGAFAKAPTPFSIAQLKEIGASLAKNCGRL